MVTSSRSHSLVSRRRKVLGPLLVLGTAVTLVAACGASESSDSADSSSTTARTSAAQSSGEVPAELPPAADVITESARTTETLRSVHVSLETTGIPNLPVESVDGDVTNLPEGSGSAAGVATVRTEQNADFTTFKFKVTNKTLYTTTDDVTYVEVGPAETIYDPGILLDKDRGLANVVKNVQDPKADARETVEGVDTVKITGTIDAGILDPVIPRIGEGGGTLPITLWIADVAPPAEGDATTVPSEAPSEGVGPNLVKFVVEKGDGTATVVLSKWAEPVSIPE